VSGGWWGGYAEDVTVRQAMAYGASQDPWELTKALELVAALDPKLIMEIGCDRGGTLYAWTAVAPQAQVWGITLADNGAGTGGSGLALETHGAKVLIGDSHDPATLAWFADQMAGPCVDVLFLDGDHSAAGVRQDLAMYGPLVRAGGLILLHDICSAPDVFCPVEVRQVWEEIHGRYATEEIRNPDSGGQGWGVIRVAAGDDFAVQVPA